ncbi:MAG: preprotein translocase subunit SecE [Acidobacteria bacterium]|nr:preprotein translocase subunit SecE [Acidobacteriota bacterium]
MTESGHDDEPERLPESTPERGGSSGVSMGGGSAAAPRMARFGEGPEGAPARKQRASSGGPGGGGPRDGFLTRAGKFLRDVRAELGRVTWPTTTEVRNTTFITVIAVIFFAAYLYAVDHGFAFVIDQIQRWVGGAA